MEAAVQGVLLHPQGYLREQVLDLDTPAAPEPKFLTAKVTAERADDDNQAETAVDSAPSEAEPADERAHTWTYFRRLRIRRLGVRIPPSAQEGPSQSCFFITTLQLALFTGRPSRSRNVRTASARAVGHSTE